MATCVSSAPSCAPSTGNDPAFSPSSPTRRGLLGLAAGAAVLVTSPALAGSSSPFRRAVEASEAAERRFHCLPHSLEFSDPLLHAAEEGRMLTAYDAMLAAQPVTWAEFVEKLSRVSDEGQCGITEEVAGMLMHQARQLEQRR